jgi:hypothetical protein
MPKKRCWTFNFLCLNNECKKKFDIKMEMTDNEAVSFSQNGAFCKECTKEMQDERVNKMLDEKGEIVWEGQGVEVKAKDKEKSK